MLQLQNISTSRAAGGIPAILEQLEEARKNTNKQIKKLGVRIVGGESSCTFLQHVVLPWQNMAKGSLPSMLAKCKG
jgi:acetate kinase